jgi:LPS-assembly protein
MSALASRLAGATALACLIALGAMPHSPRAQEIDLESADISPNAQMLLEADTIVYDNDQNTITAVGGVRIDYDGNRLVAQRVTYDRATARVIASGGVELVDRDGTKFYAQSVDVTDDFSDGFVEALRVETADKVYFAAESARRERGEVTTFEYGVYTACEPCEERPDKPPIWRVKARKIIWNGETKMVRFERARFEFFGAPIAFLPVFEIADPTVERKTGFLIPGYRSKSELGHGFVVPFYWALSPTYDLTLYPTYYTKQGFLGEAEWRQRFNNGEYSLRMAGIDQQDRDEFGVNTVDRQEDLRGMIGSKGRFEINPRWTFGWDILAQTDKNFSRTYGVGGYNQLNRTSEVYLTGLNDRNYFDLHAYRFQVQEELLDSNPASRDDKQPWVLPSFDYAYTVDEPVAGGELNFDVNMQGIYRDELDQSGFGGQNATAVRGGEGTNGRITAQVEWKRSFITPGGLMLTPLLAGRADAIGAKFSDGTIAAIEQMALQQGVDSDVRSAYFRYMATAGLEARWPILFSTSSATHILEPMGQIFARPDAPYGSSLGIPNEDAQSLVYDATNLFERDKFSGYDRIEGGVRANVGIRYSGAFAGGWSANALFGQSFHLAGVNPYASPDLVHAGAFSGLETAASDYVGAVGVISPQGLSLNAGGRFDEETFELRRADLTAGYSSRPFSLASTYSYIEAQPLYGFDEDRHEIRASTSVRFAENWRVFGGGTYDIEKEVVVSKSIGFAYDDECFSYAITATERINRNNTEDKSRSIGFSVSLRTIGDFGTSTSGGRASFN